MKYKRWLFGSSFYCVTDDDRYLRRPCLKTIYQPTKQMVSEYWQIQIDFFFPLNEDIIIAFQGVLISSFNLRRDWFQYSMKRKFFLNVLKLFKIKVMEGFRSVCVHPSCKWSTSKIYHWTVVTRALDNIQVANPLKTPFFSYI